MVVTLLQLTSAATAFFAAWFWYQSASKQQPSEMNTGGINFLSHWLREGALQNRRAAGWTAISVSAQAMATIYEHLLPKVIGLFF